MLEELRNRLGVGESSDVNLFQLDGENYRIRFGGKAVFIVELSRTVVPA